MNNNFENILYLFLIIMVGFSARKLKLLGEDARAVLSLYTINIALPMMILTNLRFTFETRLLQNAITMLVIGGVVFAVSIILSELSAKWWRLPDEERASYHFGMVLSNTGFLGLPILSVTYGQEAVFYGTIIHFFFLVVNWTYGVYVYTRDEATHVNWKAMINPSTIALVVGFTLFFFSVPLPSVMERMFAALGGTATPLTMFVIGIMMAEIHLKELVTSIKPFVLAIYRSVLFPLALFFILKSLGFSGLILYVPVVLFGMPLAANTVILAQVYGKDYKTATKLVLISTLLALVTIPLLIEFIALGG